MGNNEANNQVNEKAQIKRSSLEEEGICDPI